MSIVIQQKRSVNCLQAKKQTATIPPLLSASFRTNWKDDKWKNWTYNFRSWELSECDLVCNGLLLVYPFSPMSCMSNCSHRYSKFFPNELLPLLSALESVKTEPQITTDNYFLHISQYLVKIYNHTLEVKSNIKGERKKQCQTWRY